MGLLNFAVTLLVISVCTGTSATPIQENGNYVQYKRNLDEGEGFHFKPGSKHLRPVFDKRQTEQVISPNRPTNSNGKVYPIAGGTNDALDTQNPSNLIPESTDSGSVVNLKWSFSQSKTRVLNGGWVREQAISDLPASRDIAGAQLHLAKGAIREFHWHRVAEWGYLYKGRVSIAAVDHDGRNQFEILEPGDVWYFPEGEGHAIQGLDDENEFLLCFDDGDFGKVGTTFNLDDWLIHTPKDILARSFGLDESVFDNLPERNPYIQNATVNMDGIDHPFGELEGNLSYVYHASKQAPYEAPGGGGTIKIIDTTVFPVSKTIVGSVVELKPGGLRELHWHPNAEEWLYFHQGQARATVFIGNSAARTFNFVAGDTAVFPDNSGHYIENTSQNETLVWFEIYKSDRVMDVSLTQWLALTPPKIVAAVLRIPVDVAENLKKEKQILLA